MCQNSPGKSFHKTGILKDDINRIPTLSFVSLQIENKQDDNPKEGVSSYPFELTICLCLRKKTKK